MKSKNMTLMVVAIGCGLVAAFLTARLSGNSGPEMVDIFVAKKELPVGTILEEKDFDACVAQAKFLKSNVPPDVINSVEELKGKRINRTLKPGNFFTPGDVGNDVGIKLPEGMFKYAIKMDGVKAAAGFVQPGDHVDVILTEQQPNGKAKSGVILRDMLVLAVDTHARPTEGGVQGRQTVNSVSVAATPDQSLVLSSAEKRGEVKLMLRDAKNPDHSQVAASDKIPGFDDNAGAAQPAAPTVKMVTVVVAKAEVPFNTYVTGDNFDSFFTTREFPEEVVPAKAIKDPASLRGKFIVNRLEADQLVFNNWLADEKGESPVKTVVVEVKSDPATGAKVETTTVPESLPWPRELAQDKPLYPRKFEQIINNQRVWFIETAPGQFRRVEGRDADALKDLPSSTEPVRTEEKKPDEARG